MNNDNTDPMCKHNEKQSMCYYCYTKQRNQIVAALRAEVRAWRDADESRDEERLPWNKEQAIIKAMAATDAVNALEDK